MIPPRVVRLARLVRPAFALLGLASSHAWESSACGAVIFQTYSAYHHILVVDEGGIRTLSFDGTRETRMSLQDPRQGHFTYTELFHYAWLWNTNLSRVAMLGLGGGSTQRAFLLQYPEVHVDSVEIDPAVVAIATKYFHVTTSDRHRIFTEDGRNYLRRTREHYDLIVLDAYVKHRYGSQMPAHLATREFFELARDRMTTNGVLAYNVITRISFAGTDATRALARTLLAVFPQVYAFRATDSLNIVLLATRSPARLSVAELQLRAAELTGRGLSPPPGLFNRLPACRFDLPSNVGTARILTDDYAPVEALEGRR